MSSLNFVRVSVGPEIPAQSTRDTGIEGKVMNRMYYLSQLIISTRMLCLSALAFAISVEDSSAQFATSTKRVSDFVRIYHDADESQRFLMRTYTDEDGASVGIRTLLKETIVRNIAYATKSIRARQAIVDHCNSTLKQLSQNMPNVAADIGKIQKEFCRHFSTNLSDRVAKSEDANPGIESIRSAFDTAWEAALNQAGLDAADVMQLRGHVQDSIEIAITDRIEAALKPFPVAESTDAEKLEEFERVRFSLEQLDLTHLCRELASKVKSTESQQPQIDPEHVVQMSQSFFSTFRKALEDATTCDVLNRRAAEEFDAIWQDSLVTVESFSNAELIALVSHLGSQNRQADACRSDKGKQSSRCELFR